ncbi:GPI ethanolamine phosphate transferase 1 [Caenorhabditis elegans]|uniref:GPI ethanolamine phosphate transferase 1 n=1 Tax=Caenorhabditis elegans TaxID=6239 RepID=Q9N3C5_CAEEL|nr:GPI ethanolamine phosphate transferase 1 [Caenorhabditis elegans]CCD72995.1 GPI ethanolamine phosphate transferase 1 [Caenorhabditis elegans]|eukprot:NP_001249297.1 PhosphatidylInositol Glycan anchor biosynthesis class N homolog [Caenorhabditis elegans]
MSWKFLIASITVHLVLIYSIFDVYYTSPLVHGIPPQFINSQEAPAKRIFIISADGLRYDTFNKYPDKSPYLHSIMNERKGIYGLSRSHIPTESRPGHVAIFAGITEDISAVAKGWKKNPVQFDSVFNRSSYSWMWGSPDIVNLFDDLPNAESFSYSADEEDFASKDASNLDKWVFEHFENFLETAKTDEALNDKMREQKSIFFLHLLGIDTNGHGNKPMSRQYIDNIKVVDSGIEKVQHLVDAFFGDHKTAWLFTSDHGMTDWGSHGAGSDDEVLTPFVAWGAGVKQGGPKLDLNQIDLAPLISALIGCPIPVNSMGILPVQMMNSKGSSYEFKAIEANFKQLKEQIIFLKNAKSRRLWFRQFEKFGDKAMESLRTTLAQLGRDRRFSVATSLFADNAHLMKEAIVFYHRYDRQMLGAAVSCSFVAWIALVVSFLHNSTSKENLSLLVPHHLFIIPLACSLLFTAYCSLSMTQTIYIILPIYLISILENHSKLTQRIREHVKALSAQPDWLNKVLSVEVFVKPFLGFVGFSITICIFVLTFMDRAFLAAVFVLLMALPQFYSHPIVSYWSKTWLTLCLVLCIFPFLPAVGVSTHIPLCILSPIITAFLCHRLSRRSCLTRIQRMLELMIYVQSATAFMIAVVNYGFEKPPSIARWISWTSIPLSVIAPSLLTGPYLVDRLIAYALCFYVPYSLLSISYESLFMLIFLVLLTLFVRFEFGHLSDVELLQLKVDSTKISTGEYVELRRTVVCVSFVLCPLFGTGNFASINSFNPSTLNLFISVFSPFTMAILLILKLLIPILLVTSAFASIVRFDQESIQRLCCFSLIFTDFMSMCFFHQLRDEGSWLDIGMSISQFIVSMCISLALLLLLSISSHLMAFEFRKFPGKRNHQEIESISSRKLSDDESA